VASDRSATRPFRAKPIYLQVHDALIERIARGEWKVGMLIPNEVDLARELGISTGTVRKALELLESERVVSRRQGRGTFVNDQSSDALTSRFENLRAQDGKPLEWDTNAFEFVEAAANEDERRRLHLGASDHVYRARRVQLNDGRPFMVEEVSLPAALFPGLSAEHIKTRLVVLAQSHGILLGKVDERISIDLIPAAIAGMLEVAPNTPVLLLDRIVQTLDGRPVEWRVARCHLDGGFYVTEMG